MRMQEEDWGKIKYFYKGENWNDWTMVERDFPKILHSPHTPRFDFLLEAMESDTLARSDMKELYSLLNEEVVNSNPDYGRRLVAIVLMERLRQKIKAT